MRPIIRESREHGWGQVVSHRSGETEDAFNAGFVMGAGVRQIKSGALSPSERVGKHNQLLRIEEELGSSAHFAGRSGLRLAE